MYGDCGVDQIATQGPQPCENPVLVGPGKEDFGQNKILTNSPIGKGLVGKKKGDIAEIQVPMGTLRFEIVEIAFGD